WPARAELMNRPPDESFHIFLPISHPVVNIYRGTVGIVLPADARHEVGMARPVNTLSIYPAPPEPAAPTPEKGRQFLRLFVQTERRFYAYILTLLPNRADADDVLQEASLVMWDKFDDRRPPDDFAAWGCRIAYFKVLDFCKKR